MVAENTFEKLGLHTTGAAQYACLLSDNSRIDVTPYIDGTTHLSFIRYGRKNEHGRKRGFVIQPGTVAMNYGFYNTVIGRSGTELLIAVEGFGEYRIQNLDPMITLPVYGFDVMTEKIQPAIYYLVKDGEFCNLKTGGTFVNNLFTDRVIVKFIARVPYIGSEFTLVRNDVTTVLGMTYSDARMHMVNERRAQLGEEMMTAYNEVMRQTHLQIPSKHDRDNTGKAIANLVDKNVDGSGIYEPQNLLYRMISTNPIIINNLDKPEYNIYLNDNEEERITKHSDIADVWGMKIGPQEASRANVTHVALISDGNYVPKTDFEKILKNKIREKHKELNEAGIMETYILAHQKIEDARGGAFTEKLINMCVAEAAYFGGNTTNYVLDTVKFLELAQMENTIIEFDTSFAMGSVLSFGRRGVAQGFKNHFHGTNVLLKEHATKTQYNELINGTAVSSVVDNTTGLFLFSNDAAKEILPIGLQVLAPDDGDDALTLVGYTKSHGDIDEYKCRTSVINLKWRLNIGKLLMTQVDGGEPSVDNNYMRILSYTNDVVEMVVANVNWYIMHILLNGWDNISMPLGDTYVYRAVNSESRYLILEDTEEQLVRTGRFDTEGVEYFSAKFPSNGDRITFGVPNIDRILSAGLGATLGYSTKKFSNASEPFILVDEDNYIAENDGTLIGTQAPPIAVLQTAISSGEMVISKTDSGFLIKEPHWASFDLSTQDRSIGLHGWGNKIQTDISAGGIASLIDGLLKKVTSLEERIMRVPYTFAGTVISESDGSFSVLPDGRDLQISAEKISGSKISVEDRVFGFEREPGKFSIMKLPIAATNPVTAVGDAEESVWFHSVGE